MQTLLSLKQFLRITKPVHIEKCSRIENFPLQLQIIGISDMKPFLSFYRVKTLDDSSLVMINGLSQKSYQDVTHNQKLFQNC